MIILIDAEKTFNKSQLPLMTKPQQSRIEGNFLNLRISTKFPTDIKLNSEKLIDFL